MLCIGKFSKLRNLGGGGLCEKGEEDQKRHDKIKGKKNFNSATKGY